MVRPSTTRRISSPVSIAVWSVMQQNLSHVLNGRVAPVHTEHSPVNVGGLVAGQEHHRGCDLLRCAHPPRRDAGQQRRDVAGELLLAIGAGATALTRTPNGPYSSAHDWVNEWITALLAL